MTVNTDISTASYTGNGSTASFSVPFYFLVDTDLSVLHKTAAGVVSTWVLNSDYTLAGSGVEVGGTITPSALLPAGDEIYISRNVDVVQQTEYPVNGPFPAASHERALDRLTMIAQQLQTNSGLTLLRNPLGATYDLAGNTLVNGAAAINPADVPNLQQVQALTAAGSQAVLNTSAGASLVGFQQAGTGATVRTLQDKSRETISVKDFGAVGDGVANDTTAIQAAMTYAGTRNSVRVFFPAGQYKVTATIVVPPYTTVEGDGKGCTTLVAATASMTVFSRTFGTYSYAYQHFRDLSISTTLSGVTGMQFTLCESVIISDMTFIGCTVAVAVDRGQHYTIERVTSEGNVSQPAGTFVFTSSVDTDYVFHVTMTDVLCHNVGTGVSLVQGAFIFCRRAVGCAFDRILANSLTANNVGGVSQNFLVYENDCQGNRVSNCLIAEPKFGIITRTGTGVVVPPTFTSIHNVDIDQATSGSYLFDTAIFVTVTGGALTPNASTVAATPIQINTATFITIRGTLIANFTGASAFFFNGATNITVMGCFISTCLTAFTFAGTSTGIKILGNSAITVTNKTQGTFAQPNNIIRDNTGINPLPVTNPTMPVSGTLTTNNFGVRCSVYVAGSAVTAYAINGVILSGIQNTQAFVLEPGDKINIQYSSIPAWTWVGH